MPFGFTVDGPGFAHTWLGKRATRWLRNMLDTLGGEKNIRFLIQSNQNILDKFPKNAVEHYRKQLRFPKQYIDSFTDDEVYGWIPEEYREIIESEPNGKEWAQGQVKQIRGMLIPS